MKKEELDRRLIEICNRLDELAALDLRIIQPRGDPPVTIPLEEFINGYGARLEERHRLQEELRQLAAEAIEV